MFPPDPPRYGSVQPYVVTDMGSLDCDVGSLAELPQPTTNIAKKKSPALMGGGPYHNRFDLLWAQQGLNLRLPPCEGGTLPLSYAPVVTLETRTASSR